MRKRWRERFSRNRSTDLDSPTSMPVSVPDAEELSDIEGDARVMQQDLFGGSFDFDFLDDPEALTGVGSATDEQQGFPPKPPQLPFMHDEPDSRLKFVDKGSGPSHDEPTKFEKVATSVPSTVVSAAVRLTDKKPILFPWEKGRLGRIFGDQGRLSLKQPKLHAGSNNFVQVGVGVSDGFKLDGSVSVQPATCDKAIYRSVVKHIVGCTYMEERVAQREHAIRQWWDLLRLNLSMSDPGRAAVHEKGLSDIFRYGLELLDAVFGLKSPGTLMKRLCAIKLFNQWLIRNYTETWLPLREQHVWSYIRFLRESKAPASRAVSLLESIRFCHYMLKVDGSMEILESLRVRGLASQLFANKKPWRPSDVLTVNDVEFLHHSFMDSTKSDIDRVFIGHLLHMLYARARFSDLLAVSDLFLDSEDAFLEVNAALHKGARSLDAKSKLLPIVAPAVGFNGENWAKTYLDLRRQVGLRNPKEEPVPMLLAPNKGVQGWNERYITSQELNHFIKRLFSTSGRPIAGRKITTHSMKATTLSWCAKLGVPEEHRAILARHAKSVQGATVLYSRDLITSALRSLTGVLSSIKDKGFHPDKTRSGMITPAAATPAGAPATPFNMAIPVAAVGQGVHGAQANVDQDITGEAGGDARADGLPADSAAEMQSPNGVAWDGCSVAYSPGTPLQCIPVKEEFTWPDSNWDGSVIDLEEQHDLMREWHSGSEEESSGCSESDDSEDYAWEESPREKASSSRGPALVPKWYINVKTNVIHERRNDTTFRCGRPMGATYVAIPALTGLRCGKCFAHSL